MPVLTAAATQIVARVPRISRSQNVATMQPSHGAERIERVDRGHVLPPHVRVARGGAGGGGQCAAHRDRRHGEHDRAQHDARDGGDRAPEPGGSAAGEIEVPNRREQQRASPPRTPRQSIRVARTGSADGDAGRRAARAAGRPRPSPPMKIASTAADAAVEAPKISRKSRSQATWYTSAQKPEPKSRAATSQVRERTGQILTRDGSIAGPYRH